MTDAEQITQELEQFSKAELIQYILSVPSFLSNQNKGIEQLREIRYIFDVESLSNAIEHFKNRANNLSKKEYPLLHKEAIFECERMANLYMKKKNDLITKQPAQGEK